MNTLIVFGSTIGNTRNAAKEIHAILGGSLKDAVDVSKEDFEQADLLILGTSTWGYGDLQDDWIAVSSVLNGLNLHGKKAALFGLGDQESYTDTYVDGMGELYEMVTKLGAKVIGRTSVKGYSFSSSRAVVDDRFVGLALDDDNQSEQTGARISAWTEQVKQEAAS